MIFFLLHSLLITNLSIMMLEKLYLPSTQWTFSEAKCHSYLLAGKKKKKSSLQVGSLIPLTSIMFSVQIEKFSQ